jgi:NAD(P)H-nitrite reductase large subunit
MTRHHLIIGSGPGAISAAEAVRSVDHNADITLLTAEPDGYYSRPGLAYYLAKEVPERALFPFSAEDFSQLRLKMLVGRAEHIDSGSHVVTLADGRRLSYDRLLLSTGSRAIDARVPGADLDGVVKLDDMSDARDLIRRSRHAKTAVVVGGGITALEIVEGLRERGLHVHYLMRKDRYWSNVLSQTESRLVEKGLQSRGVEIHYFTELAGIAGHQGRAVGVETADGSRIACDLVGVAIGVRPHKELAEQAGLACGRGVLVDEYLRSSDPDVYAVGDVAEVRDPLGEHATLEVLWSSAVSKGRVAGRNMAAEPSHVYRADAPLNVTRLAGQKVTIIGSVGNGEGSDLEGLSRGDSETWGELGAASMVEVQIGDAHVRLALGEREIVGAVVMGNQALSFPLQDLISERADTGDITRDLLARPSELAEIVQGFWANWKSQRA